MAKCGQVVVEEFVKKEVLDNDTFQSNTCTIILSNSASKFEDDTKYHLDLEMKAEDSTAENFQLGNGTAQLFLNTDQGTKIEVLTAVDEAEFFGTPLKSEPLDGQCHASQPSSSLFEELTMDNNTIKVEMIENQQPAAWEASCPEFCIEPLKIELATNEDIKDECASATNSGILVVKTEPVECKPFQCNLYQDSADISSSFPSDGHGQSGPDPLNIKPHNSVVISQSIGVNDINLSGSGQMNGTVDINKLHKCEQCNYNNSI